MNNSLYSSPFQVLLWIGLVIFIFLILPIMWKLKVSDEIINGISDFVMYAFWILAIGSAVVGAILLFFEML